MATLNVCCGGWGVGACHYRPVLKLATQNFSPRLHQVGKKEAGRFVGQVPFVPLEGHWKARGPAKGPADGYRAAQRRKMAPGEVYLGPPPPPQEEEGEDQEDSPEEEVGLDSSSLGALSSSSAPGKRRPGGQPGNRNRTNFKGNKGVPSLAATNATNIEGEQRTTGS